jgi:hypothetical protein
MVPTTGLESTVLWSPPLEFRPVLVVLVVSLTRSEVLVLLPFSRL